MAGDGEYFAKFKESPVGAWELVNEYVGDSLAFLKLSVLEPPLAVVRQSDIDRFWRQPENLDNTPFHFWV